MTEEEEGTEETGSEDGPTAEGREEADDVAAELKEHEDEMESGDASDQ